MGTEIIKASLSVIDLYKDHVPYEAISYTWGDGRAEIGIIVDGAPVKVRTNLHQCLTRLRHKKKSRALWCDFLCITQTDLDEKAQQVQMIGSIFHSATCVLVWLGEHADSSEELLKAWSGPGKEPGSKGRWNRLMGAESTAENESVNRRAWIWVNFLHRAYWRRTWIVQELKLAREIVIHLGRDVTTWEDLISSRFGEYGLKGGFDGISTEGYASNDDFDNPRWLLLASLSWLSKFVPIKQKPKLGGAPYVPDEPQTIFEVAGKYQNTLCFDKRDKVFAVHTLASRKQNEKVITINYKLSLPELVISLYADRYVRLKEPKSLLGIRSVLASPPLADGLIEAFEFDRKNCEEASQLALKRCQEDKEIYSKRWKSVSKELQAAMKRVTKQREFDELMLKGEATITHMSAEVDEKLFWLGRRKKYGKE